MPMVNGLCVWCLEHSARCRKCSRCRGPWYCSQDCQLSHWSAGHREECWGNSFVHACVELPTVLKDRILDRFIFSSSGLQRGGDPPPPVPVKAPPGLRIFRGVEHF